MTTAHEPGRELDALVAEKVMGWTGITHTRWGPRGTEPGQEAREPRSVPPYSTHIGWAWAVVEAMRQHKVYEVTIEGPVGPDTEFDVTFERQLPPAFALEEWGAFGESVPHAVCLAALKVTEVAND